MKRLILILSLLGLFWICIVFEKQDSEIKKYNFWWEQILSHMFIHNQMKYKGGQTIKTLFLSI